MRDSLRSLRGVISALHRGKCRKDSSHRGCSMFKDVIESWNSKGFTQFGYDYKSYKRVIMTLDNDKDKLGPDCDRACMLCNLEFIL